MPAGGEISIGALGEDLELRSQGAITSISHGAIEPLRYGAIEPCKAKESYSHNNESEYGWSNEVKLSTGMFVGGDVK